MFKIPSFVLASAALALSLIAMPSQASVGKLTAFVGVSNANSQATGSSLMMAKSRSGARSHSSRRASTFRSSTSNHSQRTSSSSNSCSAGEQAAIRVAVEPQQSRLLADHPECRSQFPDL